ncbi:MAG: hypothetical protein K2J27_09505 [Duncaniella sp.]|nr:hypothetical protein [Duncaniella sp.]
MSGKEPELQAIGWLAAIALALILIMAAVSCSSHRNVNAESTVFMETVDSALTSVVSTKASSGVWWHTTALDSLRITISADSIVTQRGAILHRPSIGVKVVRPVIANAVGAMSTQTDSLNTKAISKTDIATTSTFDEQSETKPTENGWAKWFLLLIVVAILILLLARKD